MNRLRVNEEIEVRPPAQIASNPKQAKYLLSVERQQKVKEALYLYLLQKRRKMIVTSLHGLQYTHHSYPDGSMVPTSPVKRKCVIGRFCFRIITASCDCFIRENMNTTVRGRKDLERMTTPFVGEIPFVGQNGKMDWKNGKKKCVVAGKRKNRDIIKRSISCGTYQS